MQNVTPFLMFTGDAEQAINFYIFVFEPSEILNITRHPGEPGTEGKVLHATFKLKGQEIMAIDSLIKHQFGFTPAMSLFVRCSTDEEITRMFQKLSEGGQVMMPLDKYPFSEKFGWISDRFGVSWQLTLDNAE